MSTRSYGLTSSSRLPSPARLADAHRKLVPAVLSRRFPSLREDPERWGDAMGWGYLSLVRAAQDYDPSRGSFSAYAWPCVVGGVLHYLGSDRRARRLPTVPLETPAGDDGATLGDLVADDRAERPGERLAERDSFARLVACLTAREREAMAAIYEGGATMEEAALALGISKARVGQLHDAALARLRRAAPQ